MTKTLHPERAADTLESMKMIETLISPNISSIEIPVEFLILHYTACDLQKTLEIFLDPQQKVSSHFVIDFNGDCYDLGRFLNGPILRGAHAGQSRIETEGKIFAALNEISIGIEVVNLNGNLFDYTDAQYASLVELTVRLQDRFPILKNPNRIVGHEHIAAWRGKVDPGWKFDWDRFFHPMGLQPTKLHHQHGCNDSDLRFLKDRSQKPDGPNFWPRLSTDLEKRVTDRNSRN